MVSTSNWFIALGIAIFLSIFVGVLGFITGQNVFGYEILILYQGVNLFMIILRVALELVIVIISVPLIVVGSLGLGAINELLGTNFTVQIFYNLQAQALDGVEGIYTGIMDWFYGLSVVNERLFNVDIPFSPKDDVFELLDETGSALQSIWDNSIGSVVEKVLEWVRDLGKEVFEVILVGGRRF